MLHVTLTRVDGWRVTAIRFLVSTHYTHYDPWAFAINITSLVFVLVATEWAIYG